MLGEQLRKFGAAVLSEVETVVRVAYQRHGMAVKEKSNLEIGQSLNSVVSKIQVYITARETGGDPPLSYLEAARLELLNLMGVKDDEGAIHSNR